MKFTIKFCENTTDKQLNYILHEHSFDMDPESQICYDLVLNTINLSVIDNIYNYDIVVGVWGFCGLPNNSVDLHVPKSQKGCLIVADHLMREGGSYSVSDIDFPVYKDNLTDWICVGDPSISFKSVEFIKDCIAVLNEDSELAALWLKPKYI